MKNLFKNSFFSFLKNKVAIFLLLFIIFATSLTFTMFNSATSAFSRSYNQVMNEGNRHEYTIKEFYSIDGDVVFQEPTKAENGIFHWDVYGQPILQNNSSYISFNGEDHILIDLNFDDVVYSDKPKNPATTAKVIIKKQDAIDGNFTIGIFAFFEPDENGNIANTAEKGIVSFPKTREKFLEYDATNVFHYFNYFDLNDVTVNQPIEIINFFNIYRGFGTIQDSPEEIRFKVFDSLERSFSKEKIEFQRFRFGLDLSSEKLAEIYKELNNINQYIFSVGVPILDADLSWEVIKTQKMVLENFHKSYGAFDEFIEFQRNKIYQEAKFKLHENMLAKLNSYDEVKYKDVKTIQITSTTNLFKMVREQRSDVNKIKIFSGANLPAPTSKEELIERLKLKITNFIDSVDESDPQASAIKNMWNTLLVAANNEDERFYTDWSLYVASTLKTMRVVDLTSFAAIVSPSYAEKHRIEPMSQSTYNKIISDPSFIDAVENEASSFDDIKNVLNRIIPSKEQKSIIYSGSSPFFVLGIGITPDFSYPIIGASNPIIDANNQAVLYANNSGYERIRQANLGSITEDYIAMNIDYKTSAIRKEEIINEISNYVNAITNWPDNINALEKWDSENETVLLAPQRVKFLHNLNKTISTVSYMVTGLLTLFTAFIVSLVIKKQIDSRRKQLGILLANGYSKAQVALSMTSIALIIAFVPTVLGYSIGHFMQVVIMKIFNNYWTIPILRSRFDLVSLLLTVMLPIIGISLLAYLISLLALRGRIPDILVGESLKSSLATKTLSKGMKFAGIKTKMGTSLMISNIGKLFIGLLAFTGSIISMTVSISSLDKFDIASRKSLGATSYEYQIDLVTPTAEAGLYATRTLSEIFYNPQDKMMVEDITTEGILDAMLYPTKDAKKVMDQRAEFVDHYNDAIILHTPNVYDAFLGAPTFVKDGFQYEHVYPYYLKNRIQIKSLLNFDISAGINPWQIASQMMPENQKNTADTVEAEFINYIAHKYANETEQVYQKYWKLLTDISTGPLVYKDGKYTVANDLSRLSYKVDKNSPEFGIPTNPDRGQDMDKDLYLTQEYRHFIAYGIALTTREYMEGDRNTKLPYYMSYNNLLTNSNDETYTYIDIDFTRRNIKGKEITLPLKIRGINNKALKDNSSLIYLSEFSKKNLFRFYSKDNEIVPIVINKYMEEYYNLKIGNTFTAPLNNTANRYLINSKPEQKFEIVGIEDTYDEGRVYSLQDTLNEVLGLTALEKSGQIAKEAFNGIMTKEKSPLIFNSISLYSPSGIYPGKNNIKLSNTNEDGYISINDSFFLPNSPLEFPNPKVRNMDELMLMYGSDESISPMSVLYSHIDWSAVSEYQFKSIMELSSTLMNAIQSIILIIAMLFVLLISTMIIADNTKFIATLKVLGYRGREISLVFLLIFIPALLLSVAIATPIAFGVIAGIKVAIMGFGHVLIPLSIVGWEIAVAVSVLSLGFLSMYALSLRNLKNTSMLQAFSD